MIHFQGDGPVTASPHELSEPSRGLVSAIRTSISRNEFFAGLYFLGCANGLLGRFLQALNFEGWEGAASSLDINIVVLFACFAGILAILAEKRDEIRAADFLVAVFFLLLVSLPIFPLSWVAVTWLSIYILLCAKGDDGRKRGAIILLALTIPMLWSRLLFQLFGKLILDIDAFLIASVLGTDRAGNMVGFADGSGHMVVLPACSSLANMSLAFLCWISVTQWARHRWSVSDIVWSSLACASVIAVNVTRISLMGLSKAHYTAIHSEWGDMITNSIMLVLMVGFSVMGARREIFSRV